MLQAGPLQEMLALYLLRLLTGGVLPGTWIIQTQIRPGSSLPLSPFWLWVSAQDDPSTSTSRPIHAQEREDKAGETQQALTTICEIIRKPIRTAPRTLDTHRRWVRRELICSPGTCEHIPVKACHRDNSAFPTRGRPTKYQDIDAF